MNIVNFTIDYIDYLVHSYDVVIPIPCESIESELPAYLSDEEVQKIKKELAKRVDVYELNGSNDENLVIVFNLSHH